MVTALLGSSEMDGHGQVLHCDARVQISSKATRGREWEKGRLLASVLTSGAMSANWSSPCQEQKRGVSIVPATRREERAHVAVGSDSSEGSAV